MPRGLFDPLRAPVPAAHKEGHAGRHVYTVTEVTSRVRRVLEEGLGAVWVTGEVSNLSRPASGHSYFTLKDDSAQIQAVIWKGVSSRLGFAPRDGDSLIVLGKVSVYELRGAYQIVVERAELAGLGALQRRLEELKGRLGREGLFAPERKRPLPLVPRAVAIVTSPSGAAIHDMLRTIWGRFPGARIVLRPTLVQGEAAAEDIARAIEEVNVWGGADAIIVGRGGGSLEDLWPFNEEAVARAIARSRAPVVSAVGHEVDVSVSDLVADVRALTPTDAGTRVVPREEDLRTELELARARMRQAVKGRVSAERERLRLVARSYGLRAPGEVLARERRRVDEAAGRLAREADRRGAERRRGTAELARRLEELSPVAVLARGYSVTMRAGGGGRAVRDASELKPGDRLVTRLSRGEAESVVERVRGGGRAEE